MSPAESPEIHLLLEWPREHSRRGSAAIYAVSVFLNLCFLTVVAHLPAPRDIPGLERNVVWDQMPLYLPPDVLTQKTPNRQDVTKQINLEDLLASRATARRSTSPPPARRKIAVPKPVKQQQVAQADPSIAPDLPEQKTSLPPAGFVGGNIPPAPPPPEPAKNPFQDIGASVEPTHPRLSGPKSGIQAAINELAQKNANQDLIITDDNSSRPSLGGLGSLNKSPEQHAAVELKSDPQGADMKPYLTRILAIVRANWRTVTPESARLGTRRGCTVMEFAIARDGSIPKMVVADSSGSDPLDRAAAAGLMMSNPLPPLPTEYRGLQMRLAFSFSYNLPKGSCGG